MSDANRPQSDENLSRASSPSARVVRAAAQMVKAQKTLVWLALGTLAMLLVIFTLSYQERRSTRGSIILSSPTIYTRQRLVNDRLSQENWLTNQLALTDEGHIQNFRSIDAATQMINNASIAFHATQNSGLASKSETAPSSVVPSDDNSLKPSTSNPMGKEIATPEQTTLDRFLAMSNYRDTVRSQLMQTLLDDRHDISGNTIYRLGFDATVLTGENSGKLALIFVQLTHNPLQAQPLYDHEYKKLYDEWVDLTAARSTSALSHYAASLVQLNDAVFPVDKIAQDRGQVDQPDRVPAFFSHFIDGRLCELLRDQFALDLGSNANCFADDPPYASLKRVDIPTGAVMAVRRAINNYAFKDALRNVKNFHDQAYNRIQTTLGGAPAVSNKWRDSFESQESFTQYIDEQISGVETACLTGAPYADVRAPDARKAEDSTSGPPKSPEDAAGQEHTPPENEARNGTGPPPRESNSTMAWPPAQPAQQRPLQTRGDEKTLTRITCPVGFDVSILGQKIKLYFLLKTLIVEDKFNIPTMRLSKSYSLEDELTDIKTKYFNTFAEIYASSSAPDSQKIESDVMDKFRKSIVKCVSGDYFVWLYTDHINEMGKSPRIDQFISLVNRWGGFADCEFDVTASVRKYVPYKNGGTLEDDPWIELRDELNKDNEVFVYSVDPKELMQRASAAKKAQLAWQFGASVGGGIGKLTSLEGNTSDYKDITNSLDEIENHPIVLPLGEGQSSISAYGPYKLEFGWVIEPRIGLSQNQRSQMDGTYSLSAVISVPGWWQSLDAQYRMCWVEPSQLDQQRERNGSWDSEIIEEICTKSSTGSSQPTSTDVIRLPHTANEISRKLGYELQPSPHLEQQQLGQTLYSGLPGDVILAGDRLWRSTEVFLGAQRADSIRVLPDMQGIVAHFNCVHPIESDPSRPDPSSHDSSDPVNPSQGSDDHDVVVHPHLTVVTSEGKDDTENAAILFQPPDAHGLHRDLLRCRKIDANEPQGRRALLVGQ